MLDRPDVLGKRAALGVFALVGLASLAVFHPVLTPGAGYVWDDVTLVAQNPLLHASDGLRRMFAGALFQTQADSHNDYYRPIVTLSYWLETRLFGASALAHHWANVLVHLACLALAGRFVLRRVDARGLPVASVALWLGLALSLFAIHPSRPESVAWISGRTDPLALLFALLAMEAFGRGGRLRTALASALFVIALLCKETALLLTFAFVADAWLLPSAAVERRGRTFVAGLTSLAFAARLWLLPSQDRTLGSAADVLAALGLYAEGVLAPFPPSVVTGLFPIDAAGHAQIPTLWIVLGALVVALVLALAIGSARSPKLRPFLADALWLLLPLAPVSQLLQLPLVGHVALRFLYIPMLGAAALALRAGLDWSRKRALSPWVPGVLAGALLLLYAPFTYAYASAFRSDRALWGYELALDPDRSPVLEYALHQLPMADLPAQHALSQRAVRVALESGHQQVAVRVALRFAQAYAQSLPRDACPQALLQALDRLALGDTAHIGEALAIDLQLAPKDAAQMRREHGEFWALRADGLLRCGQLAQALDSLANAPRTLATTTLRTRLLALSGDWAGAETALEAAQVHYPFEPAVERTRAAVERAHTLATEAQDSGATIVRDAHVHMLLGDLAGARRALDGAPAGTQDDPGFHQARIQLELAAGRPAQAQARLEEARAALPNAAPLWEELQARLQALPTLPTP